MMFTIMYSVPILKKALDVLRLLVEEQTPSGVTDIAKKLAISKSTTFGILRALEKEGFVVRDGGLKKYLIGHGLIDFSKKVIRGADFVTIARPFVEKLVDVVEETAFLGVREYDNVKVLDVVEARKSLKISSPIGTRTPITAGVFGKIFLSTMENDAVVRYLKEKGLTRYTDNSITDIDAYLEAIEKTRECKYAVDLEEYMKGLRAMATMVYSETVPIAALWIVGFASSMSDDKLPGMAEQLTGAARLVSERLTSL
jgi:IclR family transcriptional regulator, KDG regulon repressor